MRYRPHRGGLAESIAETINVDGRAGLVEHLRQVIDQCNATWTPPPDPIAVTDDLVTVLPYGGDDGRCGWKDVHIVLVKGFGVMGFCEGAAAPTTAEDAA